MLDSRRTLCGGSALAGAIACAIGLAASLGLGCTALAASNQRELVVTATAYNSLPSQTQGNPEVAAWGDRLEPDMQVIAVSRDLLEMGLGRGVAVKIEGLPGEYVVLDKLHRRWKRRIDVYMGQDVQAARQFGKRRVRITWKPKRR